MNAAKQAFYLFATLILLACSGWYFASSGTKFKLNAETLLTTTDTVVTQLHLRQFSSTGELANSLQSPLIRHVPKNNAHWLKTPHITITKGEQGLWEINARQATAIYGGTKITFKDNVSIHQHKSAHNEESSFSTEALTYYPKTKHAITSRDILFEQPGHKVQAKGMKADLEKKHVELLSQARGVYDPNRG